MYENLSFIFPLQENTFRPLSTILIFLYYGLSFTSPKDIYLETQKDFGDQQKKVFWRILKIPLGGHGCVKNVSYLPENLRILALFTP